MKKWILFLSFFTNLYGMAQSTDSTRILFDAHWQFFKGGVERGQEVSVNDAHWRTVDLPHDWSIEDIGLTQSPFDSNAISQVGGGFSTGGTGWYRKGFVVPEDAKGKIIRILFEGIYMDADVWLNGEFLGNHPYGYTSFGYDLTDKIKSGAKNILAVQVKNEGQNSRWYSGSGINRHVWIQLLDPVHLTEWGTRIKSAEVSEAFAAIHTAVSVENQKDHSATVQLVSTIVDPEGRDIIQWNTDLQMAKGTIHTDAQNHPVRKPSLWSPDHPQLYTLRTEIYQQHRLLQRQQTPFGIRSIQFSAVSGFLLNNKPVKLKGGCYHDDNGPLGSRAYDRAEERRVELLKASGFNAVRCSHNPPAPAFLDACDRLGLLVIDEAFDMWREGKTPFDYHLYFDDWWKKDITAMVLRDINHPSVIMWSIGNEIPNRDKPEVVQTAKELAGFVRKLDSSRPVTAAVNDVKDDKDPFFSVLDISGYNYAYTQYEPDHGRQPGRIMMGTESYALEAFDYWMSVVDHPYVIGDFIWTGFDYIGEASIGWRGYPQEKNFYPWNLAYCGDLDICGWKRPQSYYRDALWNADKLALFVHPPIPSFPVNPKTESWSKWNWDDVVADWNWKGYEGKPLRVDVYSSCEEVELWLNGKSLGRKPTNRSTKFMVSWEVPWKSGELKAVGFRNGKSIQQSSLHSSGEPAQLVLSPDRKLIRSNGQDLSYITVELQDKDHHLDPKATDLVRFSVEGPAIIAAVGNANPVSLESYQLPQRKVWRGKCLVVLKSTGQPGDIILHASAARVPEASVNIRSKPE
jgi:beta-galactosidase